MPDLSHPLLNLPRFLLPSGLFQLRLCHSHAWKFSRIVFLREHVTFIAMSLQAVLNLLLDGGHSLSTHCMASREALLAHLPHPRWFEHLGMGMRLRLALGLQPGQRLRLP